MASRQEREEGGGVGRRKGVEGVEEVEDVENQATVVRPSNSPRMKHFGPTADSVQLAGILCVRTQKPVGKKNVCSGRMRGPRCPFGVVSEPAGDGDVPWMV